MKAGISPKFKNTVHLYRKLDRPIIEGSRFSCTFIADENHCSLLKGLLPTSDSRVNISGEVDSISINNERYMPGDDEVQRLLVPGAKVKVKIALPGGEARFYNNIEEYVSSCSSLRMGIHSKNAYIVDSDYLVGEENPSQKMRKLDSICHLIQLLKKLAHYQNSGQGNDRIQLGFVVRGKSDDSYEPFALCTGFNTEILELPSIDLDLLEDILSQDGSVKAHAEERKNIFRISLIEELNKHPGNKKNLHSLVSVWNEITDCYQKNFEIYISGFSFSKTIQELADKQAELTQKLTGVINDIGGKLLSLPLSLAAVVGVVKQDDPLSIGVLTCGVLMLSCILSLLVQNKKSHFLMVCSIVRKVLKSFETKQQVDTLEDELAKLKKELSTEIFKTAVRIQLMRVAVWLPSVITVGVVVFKYWPPH